MAPRGTSAAEQGQELPDVRAHPLARQPAPRAGARSRRREARARLSRADPGERRRRDREVRCRERAGGRAVRAHPRVTARGGARPHDHRALRRGSGAFTRGVPSAPEPP